MSASTEDFFQAIRDGNLDALARLAASVPTSRILP